MPENDAPTDITERLATIETKLGALSTLPRWVLALAVTFLLPAAGAFIAWGATTARLERLERDVREQAATAGAVGELRGDVRALTVEVRQSNEAARAVNAQIVGRLDRLEQRLDRAEADSAARSMSAGRPRK